MRKPTRLLVVLPLLIALGQPPARAQGPPAEDPLLEIASALGRIAAAMEKQLESGRLDLLLRREESNQRRLDAIDDQLRAARREQQEGQQQLQRLDMELRRLADLDAAEAMGWDRASIDLQVQNLEFESGAIRARLGELESTIGGLEQERTRRQRELEDWRAFIDRELSGLQ